MGEKKLQSNSKGPPPLPPKKPLRKHSWLFLKVVFLTPLPCACEKDKLRVLMNGGELCGAAFKGLTPHFSAVVPTCLISAVQIWQAACGCGHFSFYLSTTSQNMCDIVLFALHLPILTYWVQGGVCGVCALTVLPGVFEELVGLQIIRNRWASCPSS